MDILIANLSGKPSRKKLHGRDYLVANGTMIQPRVLNGSRGPGYYPLDEILASTDSWNMMPMVLNHPQDSKGEYVSARRPDILDKYGLGFVFNSNTKESLKAELWFDVENCNRVDNRIIPAVQSGQKIELSTGIIRCLREEASGVFNSTPYTWIARNLTPDHLAILLDVKGACSVADGCGVNNDDSEAEADADAEPSWLKKFGDTITNALKSVTNSSNNVEDVEMKVLTADERKAIVDGLITNCSCTYQEGDRESLGKLDDKTLNALNGMVTTNKELKEAKEKVATLEPVANAAKGGIKVGDTKFVLNDKNEWVAEAKAAPVINTNTTKPQLTLADLPAEWQASIAYGQQQLNNAKTELINRLVANIADPTAKADAISVYNSLPVPELQKIVPPVVAEPQQQLTQNYLGAAVGTVPPMISVGGVANGGSYKPTPMPELTVNYGSPSKN